MTSPSFQLALSLDISCLSAGIRGFQFSPYDDGTQRFRIIIGCSCIGNVIGCILIRLCNSTYLRVTFPLQYRGRRLILSQRVAATERGGLLQLRPDGINCFFQIQSAHSKGISISSRNVGVIVVYIASLSGVHCHRLTTAYSHHTAILNGLSLGAVLPLYINNRLYIQGGKIYCIIISRSRLLNGLSISAIGCACRTGS